MKPSHGCPSEDDVDDYVLNRLSPARRAKMEQHLLHCADCKGAVAYTFACIDVIREERPPKLRLVREGSQVTDQTRPSNSHKHGRNT